jgi:hypothetical protein
MMIATRRSAERYHFQRGKLDIWSTFGAEPTDALATSFGGLAAFDEMRLPPGGVCTPRHRDQAEVVTYVYKGALAQENSNGCSAVMRAGEFHRMIAGRGTRHKEANASQSDWLHVFRISLGPVAATFELAQEQKRFAAAQRRNALCVIASPDGRRGSLRIGQDALVFSSILDSGHHVVHELGPGRRAWIHVVCGEAVLDDVVLTSGDGAGVAIARAVSLTVQETTEILLVDLGPPPRGPAAPP